MEKETNKLLEEIVMLLTAWLKRGMRQSSVIQELDSVGFSPKRIAELLDTTPNNVSVTLSQSKKLKK